MRSFQKNATLYILLRSFAKERCILCVLLRSLQKSVAFFAQIYILCKRTLRSLRSFTFLRKERIILLGLISRQKLEKERKRMLRALKERKRTMRSERKRTKCPTLEFCFESKSVACLCHFSLAFASLTVAHKYCSYLLQYCIISIATVFSLLILEGKFCYNSLNSTKTGFCGVQQGATIYIFSYFLAFLLKCQLLNKHQMTNP